MNIFFDIGIIIILATVGGFIARLLKQPLISFYILMGILLGPVFGLINDMMVVDVLSEIGVAFLLFIVGIELDLKRLKDVGSISSMGALLQMGFAFLAGFILFYLLGFSQMEGVYAGIVLMFSSTMVIIKLLADKNQLDTLHGRIVIGALLMQDVVAVILLSVMGHLAQFSPTVLLFSIVQGVLAFGVALFFSKFLFPQLFKYAARSQELFFLLSLAVCFSFALVFTSIGFSIAIGAFVAGLMLGNLPYNIEIISKVKSLRDFFATLFFVSMGIKLSFDALTNFAIPFVVLLILTAIIVPFITYMITILFGYNRRTAFLTAISLSQVSEFALIIVQQGVRLGHVGGGFLSLVILVTLTSIMVTAYLIKYEDYLYRKLLPLLRLTDKLQVRRKFLDHQLSEPVHDVVLIGFDRIGSRIFRSLQRMKRDVVVVDFNPDVVAQLTEQKISCIYGDISDEEVIEKMHLSKANLVVSTIPEHHDTMLMIKKIREHNKTAKIVVTAYVVADALALYEEGADYVILPHLLGGEHAGVLLETVSSDLDRLISTKLAHIDELKRHHAGKERHRIHRPNHHHLR